MYEHVFTKKFVILGYYLTAYIRTWQDVINESSSSEFDRFHFNSYIIFTLVIFFLQVNHNFPKLRDLPGTHSKQINYVERPDNDNLKRMILEFFDFYAVKYDHNYLISLRIGQWQDRQLLDSFEQGTFEQKW